MFNQIILAGRVSTAPQLANLEGYKKCTFNIAVQRSFRNRENGEYGTDFFRIHCWAGLSEKIMKTLKVGDIVIVKGRLEPNSYKNKDGVMVYENQIICEKALFTDPRDRIENATSEEEDTKEE